MAEMIDIEAKDGGTFKAYLAMPETVPAPVIIVIQEIFGINQELRDKCRALAAQGYIAVCPDLFWRLEPGVDLTDQTEEEWAKAFDLFQRFDVDKGIEDLAATLDIAQKMESSNGKVGAVGYCLGGKLAYLMACRTDVTCTAGYYGVEINKLLGESDQISHPLMLHIAEEDEYVDKDAQKEIKDGLAENPLVTLYSYPGVNHAFARGQGQNYDRAAAEAANQRTEAFFKEHLL